MAPSITGNSVSLNSLLCCNHLSSLINQGPEHTHILGPVFFLRASLVAELVKNPPAMQETLVRFLGWEDPLEEGIATQSSILAWRTPMDRGAWWATVHRVTKSQTGLSD